MRHENGNCIPAGGFCTANKNVCEALRVAYNMGLSYAYKYCADKLEELFYEPEKIMEEFMYGQETGNSEDGSL